MSDGRDIDFGSQPVIKIKGCKVNVDHSTVLIYCLVEYGWYVVVYKRCGFCLQEHIRYLHLKCVRLIENRRHTIVHISNQNR